MLNPESQTLRALDTSSRNSILTVGTKLFAEQGFDRATVRSICKAAKVNISLISYYFGGKEGLYKEIFKVIQADKMSASSTILNPASLSSKEDFRLRFSLFLEMMMESNARDPYVFKLLHNEMLEGFPRVKEMTHQHFGAMSELFTTFFEAGKKQGFVREGLDARVIGMVTMNIMMGFAAKAEFCREVCDMDFYNKDNRARMLKDTLSVILDGMIKT